MIDASDLEYASTDYTLLACATVLAQGAATLSAGAIAQWFGYAPMFIASVLLSTGGCLLLISTLDSGHGPTRLRPVWRGGPACTRPIPARDSRCGPCEGPKRSICSSKERN